MGVAVGPRVWLCGSGRRSLLTLVFSREDLRHYGYRIRRGCGCVKPLCVYFPYYYPGRGYMELTACSSSQWMSVAVGPRAWQYENGRGSGLTLVFSREDLRHYGYRIPRGCGRVKPLCVYFPYYYPGRGYMELTACSSSQWMSVAVGPRAWQCGSGRGSGLTLVFSREDLRQYGYHICLGWGRACEAPVCVFSILLSRTWVHRPDSVQQLSVSGRGSGPTCLAVWDLNDFGVFPRGPPSLWVLYTFGFGVCESPVCIFSILSRTWVHGANDVQLSVSGRGRLLVHVGLVTVTETTDVRLEWSREGEGHESDLSYLLKFLEKEILRRERSQVFKDTVQVSSNVPEARRLKAPPTAAALQTASMNVKPSAPHECGVCGKNHPTDRCFKLLHCNGSERRERVQRAGLCYRCLRKGHIAKGCSSVCSKCNGRHHKLLCGVQSLSAGSSPNVKGITKPVSMASAEISGTVESLPSVKPSASNATETISKVILVGSSARVLLQTARVKVRGAWGVTEATILFDTGSDRSYVTSELVGKVGPSWVDSQPIAYSGFGAGNTSKAQMRSIFTPQPKLGSRGIVVIRRAGGRAGGRDHFTVTALTGAALIRSRSNLVGTNLGAGPRTSSFLGDVAR